MSETFTLKVNGAERTVAAEPNTPLVYVLRNDLGLLFLVTLDGRGPVRLEALPLKLEYCHTRLASGEDAAWMRRRFRSACAALDTTVDEEADRLAVSWR